MKDAKKIGVSLESFPLGGVNLFDRGLFESYLKLFLAGQNMCRFIDHV